MSDPFGVLILGSVLGSVFAATFYGLRAFQRAEEQRIDMAWEKAARTVKGKVSLENGRKIRANVNGVDIVVDEMRAARSLMTRVHAGASHALGLSLKVRRADPLVKAFVNDRATDDPAFDDDFVVESDRPELARLWLDASTRSAIRASGDWSCAVEGGALTLLRRVDPALDGAVIARAIRSAAVIAQRGVRLTNDWSTLARKLGGVVNRAFAFGRSELATMTIAKEAVEAKLAVQAGPGDKTTTTLSAPSAVKLEVDAKETLKGRAIALGAAEMHFREGQVAIELDGVIIEVAPLRKLLALLFEAAATPSIGPYR